jgi:hypothetical protein
MEEILDCRVPIRPLFETTEVKLYPLIQSSPVLCYHDGHSIDQRVPVFSFGGITYCSASCALANADVSQHPDIYFLNRKIIDAAPARNELVRFGGQLTIDAFRGLIQSCDASVDQFPYCYYDCAKIPADTTPLKFPKYFGNALFCSGGCMLALCIDFFLPGSALETDIRAGRACPVDAEFPAPPRILLEFFGGPICLANFRAARREFYVKVMPKMSIINNTDSEKFCTSELSHYELHVFNNPPAKPISAPPRKIPLSMPKKFFSEQYTSGGQEKSVCRNLPFFRKK